MAKVKLVRGEVYYYGANQRFERGVEYDITDQKLLDALKDIVVIQGYIDNGNPVNIELKRFEIKEEAVHPKDRAPAEVDLDAMEAAEEVVETTERPRPGRPRKSTD